jgi:cytochrome c oxidase subunit 3
MMMFAWLTSAYLVKRAQPGWVGFEVPVVFWYSTAVILISSLTMYFSLKSFRERRMIKYKKLIGVTSLLGLLFMLLQFAGFRHLWINGMVLRGSGAAQFLYIIAGLHVLHVLGGVIAVLTLFVRSGNKRIRSYNSVPVEVVATYWHFVDILWIYLFIFFLWIQ